MLCCIAEMRCQRIIPMSSSVDGGAGGARSAAPIRKWPGVRAVASSGLLLSADSGLELRHAS